VVPKLQALKLCDSLDFVMHICRKSYLLISNTESVVKLKQAICSSQDLLFMILYATISGAVASNNKMISESEVEMIWKKTVMVKSVVLSLHSL
jgi:hypothetical protein